MSPPASFSGTVQPGYEEVRELFLKHFKDGRNENAQVNNNYLTFT